MTQTIAIIDDDIYIGNMLEEALTREGYAVLRAYSGTEALFLFQQRKPDLVLLDLMLPGLSGEEVLPHIKGIPVIVLSAKVEVKDKVAVLLGGAADYMTKPFDMAELLARICVQLRKEERREGRDALRFGELVMNCGTREVSVGEKAVRLTRTEYAILKLLMQNPSQVITKTNMLDCISGDTPDCMESSLNVHISNLRRKLREKDGKNYIESVWGIGFKLNEES